MCAHHKAAFVVYIGRQLPDDQQTHKVEFSLKSHWCVHFVLLGLDLNELCIKVQDWCLGTARFWVQPSTLCFLCDFPYPKYAGAREYMWVGLSYLNLSNECSWNQVNNHLSGWQFGAVDSTLSNYKIGALLPEGCDFHSWQGHYSLLSVWFYLRQIYFMRIKMHF